MDAVCYGQMPRRGIMGRCELSTVAVRQSIQSKQFLLSVPPSRSVLPFLVRVGQGGCPPLRLVNPKNQKSATSRMLDVTDGVLI